MDLKDKGLADCLSDSNQQTVLCAYLRFSGSGSCQFHSAMRSIRTCIGRCQGWWQKSITLTWSCQRQTGRRQQPLHTQRIVSFLLNSTSLAVCERAHLNGAATQGSFSSPPMNTSRTINPSPNSGLLHLLQGLKEPLALVAGNAMRCVLTLR